MPCGSVYCKHGVNVEIRICAKCWGRPENFGQAITPTTVVVQPDPREAEIASLRACVDALTADLHARDLGDCWMWLGLAATNAQTLEELHSAEAERDTARQEAAALRDEVESLRIKRGELMIARGRAEASLDAARAEVSTLQERLAAVEGLADQFDRDARTFNNVGLAGVGPKLRAALKSGGETPRSVVSDREAEQS